MHQVDALGACVVGLIELDSKFDQDSVPSLSRTEEIALFSEITFSSPLTDESPASNQTRLEFSNHDSAAIDYLEQFRVAVGLRF